MCMSCARHTKVLFACRPSLVAKNAKDSFTAQVSHLLIGTIIFNEFRVQLPLAKAAVKI